MFDRRPSRSCRVSSVLRKGFKSRKSLLFCWAILCCLLTTCVCAHCLDVRIFSLPTSSLSTTPPTSSRVRNTDRIMSVYYIYNIVNTQHGIVSIAGRITRRRSVWLGRANDERSRRTDDARARSPTRRRTHSDSPRNAHRPTTYRVCVSSIPLSFLMTSPINNDTFLLGRSFSLLCSQDQQSSSSIGNLPSIMRLAAPTQCEATEGERERLDSFVP